MQSYDKPINSLPLLHQGKVRDIYSIDEHNLLIVASDRISAFDVIMPTLIKGKGEILTQISSFWFNHLEGIIPSHINHDIDLKDIVSAEDYRLVHQRSMIVKKLKIVPIEAIARGYIIGSGWKDYLASTSICGIPLPSGLQKAEKLPQPLFTPSTKAELGDHDENISFAQMSASISHELAETIRTVTLELYQTAADFALTKGIIIADTKFEFGIDEHGTLHLADEILTPDSSRFWPLEHYSVGVSPPSFDKQFVRDYLESLSHWDKQAPGPKLPDDIATKTVEKYREALSLLTA